MSLVTLQSPSEVPRSNYTTERVSASCYRGEKVHNNSLMGLIFGTSRRVALTKKKNSLWGYGFFKKGFKSNGFQVVVWSQNLSFFLFRISSQIWRFSPKLRYLSIFLFRISSQIWRFSQKLRFSHFSFGLIFIMISSQKKASLARTVPKPSMR